MAKWKIILTILVCLAAAAALGMMYLLPDVQKIDIDRDRPSDQSGPVPQVLTKTFPPEDTSKYTIQVDYPELQGVAAPGVQEKVNGSVRASVYNQIAAFQAANSANMALGDPGLRSSFDGNFDVSLVSRSFLSAIMSYSDYSAGAAHPNSYNVALNYDLRTGESVSIDRFLRSLNPSSGYMDRLGEYVRTDLLRQFGDSEDSVAFIDAGAAPSAESYANFTLDAGNLSIHFDSYQVAPYAAGLPTVKIPYAELISGIVKSEDFDASASSSVRWWLQ